jgi:hypothetical protein
MFLVLSQFTKAQDKEISHDSTFLTAQRLLQQPVTISVSSYHCFSSSHLRTEIVYNCNGYIARWNRSYGKITLSQPGEGVILLSTQQLAALLEFEKSFSNPPNHKEACRGTNTICFSVVSQEKKLQYCSCAPNPSVVLSNILFGNGPLTGSMTIPKQITVNDSL